MLEDHKLEKFENVRVQDRFPRYVGRNAKGNPQAYGGSIQVRILTTDQGAQGWATSNNPDEEVEPLIGERISDLFDVQRGTAERAYGIDLAEKGLVDCFVIDLGIVGFTRWRKVMPELAAAEVVASPHTWCWCVRPWYAAQLGAGVGNVVCIEGIPGTSSHLDYGKYDIVDGEVVLPDAPGLAMPLKEEE